MQGCNEGVQEARNSRAPNYCGGCQMTAEGAKKSQQYHKYFLQYSIYLLPKRPQVRTWGRQTCFLPRAPCNFVTPLVACHDFERHCSQIVPQIFRCVLIFNLTSSHILTELPTACLFAHKLITCRFCSMHCTLTKVGQHKAMKLRLLLCCFEIVRTISV